MNTYPERGNAAFGAVLAASTLALGGPAAPHTHIEKHVPKTPTKNELFVDHMAQLAILDKTMVIIAHKEKEELKLTHQHDVHHTTHHPAHHAPSHHTATHSGQVHMKPAHVSPARAEWLFKLRTCESTNNYSDNTGNGYYGAYQFLPSTWHNTAVATGHSSIANILPSEASPADQDMMVILNTQRSDNGLASQNPACYKSQHLSEYPPA